MSRQLLINILCWLMVATAFANEKKQFIYFSCEGGFSPIRKLEAIIYTDGRVDTLFLDHKKHQLSHSFALNKQELARLKSLIKQVDFFKQPDKDKTVVIDAPLITVIVDSVTGYRKLQFMVRPSMVPLTTGLYKIAGHAEVIYKLRGNNLLHSSFSLQWFKRVVTYAPADLKIPLQKSIARQYDDYGLRQLIRAFALVTTPDEWIKFLAQQIKRADSKRKNLLLEILATEESLPATHIKAKLNYLIKFIHHRTAAKPQIAYDSRTDKLLDKICQFIGKYSSKKSFPALTKIVAYQPRIQARYAAERAIGDITRRERNAMAQALLNRPVPVKFAILILRNAKRFKQVIVEAVNDNHVTIMHSSGITEIPLDELSNRDRKVILARYGNGSVKKLQ